MIAFPLVLFLTIYSSIPGEISVTRGQNLYFRWGLSATAPTDNIGRFDCPVKFMGVPIKTVNVSVNPERYVIPSGAPIGVKIYTDGVLIVGMGSVRDENRNIYEPAKAAGLEIGDRITEINGEKIISTEEFTEKINQCSGKATLKVVRVKKEFLCEITGVRSNNFGEYKLGMWVRDSTAGIGTLTFYNPENSTFASLGHGICDSDTGDMLIVRKGSISPCRIINVIKGKNGSPGELMGSFDHSILGDVSTNCSVGVIGKAKYIPENDPVKIALPFQVREGKATILCDIDGNGINSYEIEITKLSVKSGESNKDFVIKVTDDILLEKTGGIVRGMSGSPILQNGKLIGAVTHVFVNDSSKGYGIFAESMLEESEKIK